MGAFVAGARHLPLLLLIVPCLSCTGPQARSPSPDVETFALEYSDPGGVEEDARPEVSSRKLFECDVARIEPADLPTEWVLPDLVDGRGMLAHVSAETGDHYVTFLRAHFLIADRSRPSGRVDRAFVGFSYNHGDPVRVELPGDAPVYYHLSVDRSELTIEVRSPLTVEINSEAVLRMSGRLRIHDRHPEYAVYRTLADGEVAESALSSELLLSLIKTCESYPAYAHPIIRALCARPEDDPLIAFARHLPRMGPEFRGVAYVALTDAHLATGSKDLGEELIRAMMASPPETALIDLGTLQLSGSPLFVPALVVALESREPERVGPAALTVTRYEFTDAQATRLTEAVTRALAHADEESLTLKLVLRRAKRHLQ